MERDQGVKTFFQVRFGREFQLAQTLRTKPQRCGVRFLEMVDAIEVAAVLRTMKHGKHVKQFMRGQTQRAFQAKGVGGLRLGRVAVSVNGPDADSRLIGRVTENEIPAFSGIKIMGSEGNHRTGIFRQPR